LTKHRPAGLGDNARATFKAWATQEPPAGVAGEGGVVDVASPAKLKRRQPNPEDGPARR
jgi:hypothetical protein